MPQTVKLEKRIGPELIPVKRNPYLVDYEEQRHLRELTAGRPQAPARRSQPVRGKAQPDVRPATPVRRRNQPVRGKVQPDVRTAAPIHGRTQPSVRPTAPARTRARSRAAAARRRRAARLKRLAVGLWILGIFVIGALFLAEKSNANASWRKDQVPASSKVNEPEDMSPPWSGKILNQGIPAEIFATHPDWTENFLTPNEYSRPGDALEQVNNIFVHYTANPGTSAAQNRSYFEQQKDTHERSVSAHFIIGYEGEIIQCIPLDEIAYAVMSRNEDSLSIECCYLSSDGSFTKETYNSLVQLLAWLTSAYNLDVDDILRHYDCGGKKCPVYYTENEDAWKRLKEDVRAALDQA